MQPAIKLHTVCMILRGDQVLLLDRRHDPVILGYMAPGGKVEFPESPALGAIREVREETGLEVSNLVYKGLHEFVNESKGERYMVFNYLTRDFSGTLLDHPPEGALEWVPVADVTRLPLMRSFRVRFPLFFEPGTFEIHTRWDEGWMDEVITRL